MYQKIKRILDFIISLILLIAFSIPMLFIAIAIRIDDKGKVFYKQPRMGKDLKVFYIYKFRTMKSNRKELECELSHDKMVTKFGKFLRATSLDEIPQLINILRGEMSFIGPRPWIVDYYDLFTEEQKHRCDVLPGLSGLAQVKGRNGISIFKKIEYDLEYVKNASLILDVKIFFLSILAALKKSNSEISEKGIKEEFTQLRQYNEVKEHSTIQ